MKKPLVLCWAAMAMWLVSGCELGPVLLGRGSSLLPGSTGSSSTTASANSGGSSTVNGAIVVNGLAANPTNIASQNDKITFSINAYDANNKPMQYSWSSTKGTLSATEGQTVYWSPVNSAGALDQGVATVQVLITDSTGASKQAAVNLLINSDGSAQTTTSTSATTTTTTTTPS
ncbi:MAG: hypothetical protein KGR26_06565 [Cyanobacteria bacterium REEB65]|nr:hypothetical protein [Cyanobacteria bacterium REEB65]